MLRAWDQFVTQHYRDADGLPTNEQNNFRQAIAPLLENHSHILAREFGPQGLKAVRQSMINRGWSRKWINLSVGRIKRLFRWAVSEELVPPAVLQGLQAVTGLSRGRTAAREAKPVQPVDDDVVEKTILHVTRHVAGMIRLQRLTGMRPGEVCRIRWCDIETTGEVWVYRPFKHKTAYQGKERAISLGPKAQALLRDFLTDDAAAFLFSPQRSVAEVNARRAATRKTKYYASRQKGQARRVNPKRVPGEKYTVCSYCYAVRRACLKAGIEPWHPNQLRHAAGTEIRKRFGLEASQVAMGHSRADVTQVYAQRDYSLAAQVAREIG
jgi:integrase